MDEATKAGWKKMQKRLYKINMTFNEYAKYILIKDVTKENEN